MYNIYNAQDIFVNLFLYLGVKFCPSISIDDIWEPIVEKYILQKRDAIVEEFLWRHLS
jgi:hypothetical protein